MDIGNNVDPHTFTLRWATGAASILQDGLEIQGDCLGR
jgi:hypothetical protein